jgi:signal peptidase I
MIYLLAVPILLVLSAWYLRARYLVITIDGSSMEPTYVEGDRVLVRRTSPRRLRRGAVVVLDNPFGPGIVSQWVIKRAAGLPGDPVPPGEYPAVNAEGGVVPAGRLLLRADNHGGGDSRTLGYVNIDTLIGIVVRRLGAANR